MTNTEADPSINWKEKLSPEQYDVMRCHGTEQAFSGKYDKFYETGKYVCAGCEETLFSSEHKYDSGSGWPSFYQPFNKTVIGESRDTNYGMVRVEVHCANCGGHLGHVFTDGPEPSGLRYCINSLSLAFQPEK